MYLYDLVDGIIFNGNVEKTVLIKPLSDASKDDVSSMVSSQHDVLLSSNKFIPVNDHHLNAVAGLLLLNEHASASIAKIGNDSVKLSFDDVCNLKVSVQDWNVILSASMAVDEFHNSNTGVMEA